MSAECGATFGPPPHPTRLHVCVLEAGHSGLHMCCCGADDNQVAIP